MDDSKSAFINLLKVGLWERDVQLLPNEEIDFYKTSRLAQEQVVIGLVAAVIEQMDSVPYETKLKFMGFVSQIQQRNEAMNRFIAELVVELQSIGVTPLLIKGQGVAQCYERPLWRTSGDVDILVDNDDYEKTKRFLLPLTSKRKKEGCYSKHIGLCIGSWYVELHGRLRTGLSARLDKEVDAVQTDTFGNNQFRVWNNSGIDVPLPDFDNDAFLLFTHFIKHFYKEGMCIRQICDWCRLLWTYKDSLNPELLKSRVMKAGLMDEWRAFAALAVDWLGMLPEAMPMYDDTIRWHKKGKKIIEQILNATHGKMRDKLYKAMVFPQNTILFLPGILFNFNWLKIRERMLKK